jgi:N-acetylglucosaminyldiphosphoundecaprenol N-acetyl-beta-D-mannosaminyltransferase
LLARAAHAGWRVFLLGAAPGVAEHAATIWARRYPGLVVAGTHAGSPDPAEDASITGQVRASNAQIVLVAYGAPRQDLWLARNLPSLREAGAALGVVGIGVGGVFDYVAGVRPLAPAWARRAGLEWFYRLVNEPSRWRRQLALLRFLGRIALSAPSRYDRDREMPGR